MKIGKIIGIGSAVLVGGYLIFDTLCWAQVGLGYAEKQYTENLMSGMGTIEAISEALATVRAESETNWSVVKNYFHKLLGK